MPSPWLAVRDILAGRAPKDVPVTVKGWVRTRRDSRAGFSFVNVSDGSSLHPVQVVVNKEIPNYDAEVLRLTAGCAVEATGTIVPSPAKGQPFEMQASAIRVAGWVEDPDHYPIQPKPHTMEFLREVAHLRPRTNVIAATTRVRHTVAQAIHRFFHERGFFWVNTPIITSSDAEGAGALFRVSTLDLANLPRRDGRVDFSQDFFGKEAFLTVSGQLNVEAYCLALTKVYTFGPTFRAENSNTSRHLAEFWMIEPEIAFASLKENADLAESLLKVTLATLLAERQEDLAFFDERIEKGLVAKLEGIVRSEFVRMDYAEAIRVLEGAKEKFEFPVKWGIDLQSEHERYLTEKHAKRPVIVMNYPKAIKAFYMRVNDDGRTVAVGDSLDRVHLFDLTTGRLRVGFGLQNANLTGHDDVLSLQYVTAPYDDHLDDFGRPHRLSILPSRKVTILGAGYKIPLYESGDSIDFTLGYSNVNSGVVANLFSITGSGTILGARYVANLMRFGDYEHRLIFSVDWRTYDNKGVRAVGSTVQLIPDVTVHPLGVTYAGTWRGQDSETGVSVGVSKNVQGGNDGNPQDFCKIGLRNNGLGDCASATYEIWRWSLNHNRALPADFQLRLSLNVQDTRDMLVPGELFGLGGADSVRGFLEREIADDKGYRGTVEIYTPDFGSKTGIAALRMRGLAFVDAGRVLRNRPGPAEIPKQGIGSVGFGIRASRGTNMAFRVDYALVVDEGAGHTTGSGRLHASFSYIF